MHIHTYAAWMYSTCTYVIVSVDGTPVSRNTHIFTAFILTNYEAMIIILHERKSIRSCRMSCALKRDLMHYYECVSSSHLLHLYNLYIAIRQEGTPITMAKTPKTIAMIASAES